MLFARDFVPAAALARIGHQRVAGDVARDLGQFDLICQRQEQREYFRPADHRHRPFSGERHRLYNAMRDLGPCRAPLPIAGDDDVPPPR